MKPRVLSYVRVSTARQGASGLGLEAQRAAVKAYCEVNGCELLAEYQEVESGTKSQRPVLRQALAHAKRAKATLLIAKLDRLSRNVAFIANLLESGVNAVACDMPSADHFQWHIMSAVAQREAKAISERTIAALTAAKARGTLLGASNPACRNLDRDARQRGATANANAASAYYEDVVSVLRDMHRIGSSLRVIAETLNAQGKTTRNGSQWTAVQVQRVLKRAA